MIVYPSIAKGYDLVGVFDGHGDVDCSHHCEKMVPKLVKHHLKSYPDTISDEECSDLFQKVIVATDEGFTGASGSTAILALLHKTKAAPEARFVTVVSVGDSRAVLCTNRNAVDLSRDHKPGRDEERKRIEESGGLIKNGRVMGSLTVSRAIGMMPSSQCHTSSSMPSPSPSP